MKINSTITSGLNKLSLEERCLLQQRILDARKQQSDQKSGFAIPRQLRSKGANAFPASYGQEQAWFLSQMDVASPSHNVSFAMRFEGKLDLNAFTDALNKMVDRHEVFRTRFRVNDGVIEQVVEPGFVLVPEIIEYELPRGNNAQREALLRGRLETEARLPFDLSVLPLVRVKIVRLATEEHVVLFTLHHIIWDGWSIGVFMNEFAGLYQGREPLPELPIQYADYAVWQRQWLDESLLEKQTEYWDRALEGKLPVLALPLDRPRTEIPSHNGDLLHFSLDRTLTAELRRLSLSSQTTMFMTLLAALNALLWRYTGQRDLLVATNIASRNCAELEPLIGYFVNQVILRTRFTGTETFAEILQTVKAVTTDAYAHQDIPLDKLVPRLDFDRDKGGAGLFQIMFVLQNMPMNSANFSGLKLSAVPVEQHTANLDIHFSMAEMEGMLHGTLEYNTDLFDAATIRQFTLHFEKLLREMVRNPHQSISECDLWTNELRPSPAPAMVGETKRRNVPESVLEIFSDVVRRCGKLDAVRFSGGQCLTYIELDRLSNRLAARLQEAGVAAEVFVAICLDRSIELMVAVLAVLKAGGAFVPLDPGYPKERLAFMLEQSGATILLTSSSLVDTLPQHSGLELFVDGILDANGDDAEVNADQFRNLPNIASRQAAYLIFTSGSSGKPKGVILEHQGLANVVLNQVGLFRLSAGTTVLQFASASFDASVFEMVMAWSAGATLCLGTREQLLPGPALARFLSEQEIQVVTLPPSSLAMLEPDLPGLKLVTVAGEACSKKLAAEWGQSRRFFNLYGPTETTIWATAHEWDSAQNQLSIGKPIEGVECRVLDTRMQPVPPGVTGEIYLGGISLARGYCNAPELTAERFVPDPFSDQPGMRLYRTGDIGRVLRSGNLEFVGRVDDQVKIRGFRVEPGEVEATVNGFPGVRDAVVLARDYHDLGSILVAYVILDKQAGTNVEEVRQYLKQQLPSYMIPSAFVELTEFPRTPSGKVNRPALPLPKDVEVAVEATTVAPRNATEQKLVEIWRRLLKIEHFGVTDDFFKLGGYSLLAVQVITEVFDMFRVEIPPRLIFTMQLTIEELANYIIQQPGASVEGGGVTELMRDLEALNEEEAAELLEQDQSAAEK